MGDVREEMAQAILERKADKRKNLEAEYDKKLGELFEEIERMGGEAGASARETRRFQLKRLSDLVKRKTDIERQLTLTTAELAERYGQMKTELGTAIQGRIDDMDRAEKVLKEDLKIDEAGKEDENGEGGGVDGGKEDTHYAGGDAATADSKGRIRNVPGKEQVKRAEEMARQGRRA